MKTTIAIAAALSALTAAPALAGDIELTIEGVQPEGGKVLVSLQTQDQFMTKEYAATALLEGTKEGALTTTMKDVPAGEYALSVLHDANNNWRMDMTPEYLPREGWAMSGDVKMDRLPQFTDARFQVEDGPQRVTLEMRYPDGSLLRQPEAVSEQAERASM